MLVCFDIDGTLANLEHRLHYVTSKPNNWKAFSAAISKDTVIPQIAQTLNALIYDTHTIILASGRSEDDRSVTEKWLRDNLIAGYDNLYMRKSGDYRADDIIKEEILGDIITDYGKKPDLVFDDRPRVVRMWRKNGVFVANVYQGDKDF